MAKIKLGSPPKTFKRTVKFLTVEGLPGEIDVQFQYRTRTEYAEFISGLYPPTTEASDIALAANFEVVGAAEKGLDKDAEHVLGAVRSWDLDDDLSMASAKRLADEFPGAVAAIISDYRMAITEGRAKN